MNLIKYTLDEDNTIVSKEIEVILEKGRYIQSMYKYPYGDGQACEYNKYEAYVCKKGHIDSDVIYNGCLYYC